MKCKGCELGQTVDEQGFHRKPLGVVGVHIDMVVTSVCKNWTKTK